MLRDLSLWDKRDDKIMTLSGGMKRRVMIAKALSHEPRILFLDEPTAGVDVELRREMWELVRSLRETGVTIILTTHYIVEAEEMADRIGVINNGEIILVEEKAELMRKLGKKQLTLQLHDRLDEVPDELAGYDLELAADGYELVYTYDAQTEHTDITALLSALNEAGVKLKDLQTQTELAGGDLRRSGEGGRVNFHAIRAIYVFEMARTFRTILQSIVTPVISTSLYFVVFGAAIGSRITDIDGVSYGAFIVPGLIMLSLLTQSISNASFGIFFPKFTGTIYELLSAPVSYVEIVISYVGAAATKSMILGLHHPRHLGPVRAARDRSTRCGCSLFLVLTAVTFSLFGFLLGIWADGFEKLQLVPLLIITPLIFLGGSFYSDRHAAAVLADGHPVQPRRLPDQRLPLELLRDRRRERRP